MNEIGNTAVWVYWLNDLRLWAEIQLCTVATLIELSIIVLAAWPLAAQLKKKLEFLQ